MNTILIIMRHVTIDHFCNVSMDVSSVNQPFHSSASFNMIYIAGIHFAYIRCC